MINVAVKFSSIWEKTVNFSSIGTIFWEDEKLNGETFFSNKLKKFKKYEVSNILEKTNGFFSMVYIDENEGWMAVDRIRSFPIFYGQKNNTLFISDDAYWIKQKVQNSRLDENTKSEFILSGYVTGSDTLFPDVKQVQAGEIVFFEKMKNSDKLILNKINYYNFLHKKLIECDDIEIIHDLEKIMFNTFRRLIDFANGRTIVVPLSGGYDSRVIVMMLKRFGYEKIIAFTYGKRGNEEAKISQVVANSLGIPWYFIEYTPEIWKKSYSSEEWKAYFQIAGNLCSLPHIQDFIAVKQLKDIIPVDSIFVPGVSADLNTGGFIEKYQTIYNDNISKNELLENIINYTYSLFFNFNGFKYSKHLKEKIIGLLERVYIKDNFGSSFEAWIAIEKVAKFVQNSVRCYEFWGYSWWTPFWDSEFISFWYRVPIQHRQGQNLYRRYIEKITVELGGCGLNYPLYRDGVKKNTNIIRKYIEINLPKVFRFLFSIKLMTTYKNHPLQWYSLINRNDIFLKFAKGASSINSFLVKEYLKYV